MTDKKISQLSAASTPLAGTEVLPIVQSSATVKVASDDLTVKNIRSNATSGILQVAGPAAAATRTMTVPDANFTVARIDAANSFTGNQTLSTGDLILGTAGKGIDFSANTGTAGSTKEILDWYEEGNWTPAQGPGLTVIGDFSSNGKYVRIGRLMMVIGNVIGSTSIACASAGVITTNLPVSVVTIGSGSVTVGNVDQGSQCVAFSTSVYCMTAITATSGIGFTAIYFV